MEETLDGKRLLLQFKHGWGDCLQFGIVLKHLRHYLPDWHIAVEAPDNKHHFFNGLCDACYPLHHPMPHRDDYTQRPRQVFFNRCERDYQGYPSTKAARCLLEEFQLEPIEDLFYYDFFPAEEGETSTDYPPYSVLHYQGKSCWEEKDLTAEEATIIAKKIKGRVLILDWEGDVEAEGCVVLNKFNTPEMANPSWVHALLCGAQTVYGVDSGVTHLAAATNTLTFCYWTGLKPWHNFDLAHNVVHVLPEQDLPDHFREHYNYVLYRDLIDCLHSDLNPTVPDFYLCDRSSWVGRKLLY
jgi:hypothetical protein